MTASGHKQTSSRVGHGVRFRAVSRHCASRTEHRNDHAIARWIVFRPIDAPDHSVGCRLSMNAHINIAIHPRPVHPASAFRSQIAV